MKTLQEMRTQGETRAHHLSFIPMQPPTYGRKNLMSGTQRRSPLLQMCNHPISWERPAETDRQTDRAPIHWITPQITIRLNLSPEAGMHWKQARLKSQNSNTSSPTRDSCVLTTILTAILYTACPPPNCLKSSHTYFCHKSFNSAHFHNITHSNSSYYLSKTMCHKVSF